MPGKRSKSVGEELVYPPHLAENIDDGSERYQFKPKPICNICLDDGIVSLLGTVREGHGPTYDKGCAPCQWCQRGYRRLMVWRDMGEKPLTDYAISDVDPPSVQVDWRDSEQRLRAKRAAADGIAATKRLLAAQANRSLDLQRGAEVTPASAPPVERPFG